MIKHTNAKQKLPDRLVEKKKRTTLSFQTVNNKSNMIYIMEQKLPVG